jgi:hypothetical protein
VIVSKKSFNQGKWQIDAFSNSEKPEDTLTMKNIEKKYKNLKKLRPSKKFERAEHEQILLQGNKTGNRSHPSKHAHKTAVSLDKEHFKILLHDVDLDGGALFVDSESPENTYELLMASTSDIFGELVSKELAEVSVVFPVCYIYECHYDSILTQPTLLITLTQVLEFLSMLYTGCSLREDVQATQIYMGGNKGSGMGSGKGSYRDTFTKDGSLLSKRCHELMAEMDIFVSAALKICLPRLYTHKINGPIHHSKTSKVSWETRWIHRT